LIVTFTVAAKQELTTRMNEDNRFAPLRDCVEVTTLNSWGFRRIKGATTSPKLITSKQDFHFAMMNQLQPVWQKYDRVKHAIEQKSNTTPRKLMDAMDMLKSLGFDHVRQTNYEQFAERLESLRGQGLEPMLEDPINRLTKLEVFETKSTKRGDESPRAGDREFYNSFFRFWREATALLISNRTFTLEDQKYFAYLDEREKLEDGKFLSGAAKIDHLLIDEFQDINPLDLALIKAIAERNKATITIVGDDDQAIFEWRGATPEYILNPDRFFGTSFATHTLARNYRSPRNIVTRSQDLIKHNKRRVDKNVEAVRSDDALIEVIETEGLAQALDLVYAEVEKTIGHGDSPSKIAIVGRKRSQIIPYQVFFASKEVSFCAAEDLQVFMSETFDRLLRLLMIRERADRPQMRTQVTDDMLELCGLVKRYPLNKSDKESLRSHFSRSGASTVHEATEALSAYRGPLKGTNAGGKISMGMAEAIRVFINADAVSDALTALGDHFEGLQMDLGRAEDDIFFVDPPFLHLAEFAVRYESDYGAFVEDIERAKDQLAYLPPFEDDSQAETSEDLWKRPVHLMTALRAKGKEFDSVILLDVIDGIWPNRHAKTVEQREAERRVFYVAFTRAKQRVLILTTTRMGNREAVPSPYLAELGLSNGGKG